MSLANMIEFITPGDRTITFNKSPEIYVRLKQRKEFFNLLTTKLFLDSAEIIAIVTENNITCGPITELSFGVHYVELQISDINKDIYKFQWCFLVDNKDIQYNFYYGVPHSHTSYSSGKGIPTEAYKCARKNGLHFLIITDHSGNLNDNKLSNDDTIIGNDVELDKWELLKKQAEEINKEYSDFLALVGFEMSTNLWGHMNVINSKDLICRKTLRKIDILYQWLCAEENIIITVNHPNATASILEYLQEFDRLINLIEVGNGSPPYEYQRMENYYFKALDMGWHVGAINGQDNHMENWGDKDNLTVIIAERLDADSIINAMKFRRVYSTETRTLRLYVKGNDHWMGSILELNKGDKLKIDIKAQDDVEPISKIQIISNNGRVIDEKIFNDNNIAEVNSSFIIYEDYEWYVVKVIHSDGRWGTSSPIFVQAQGKN
jgi:hypothetical protein